MIEELGPEQRGALGALKASRGACPPPEALVAYEAMSAADRAGHPAHDHITVCSRCQLVLLHAATPAAIETGSVLRWLLPLAAILVLGVGLTLVWRAGALAPATGIGNVETVRGSEIQPIAPVGAVNAITEFSWQSPIQADRYRVSVTRGSDETWRGETTASRIAAPAGVFDAGIEYRWVVEAIDREGEVRMTSPPQSFTQRTQAP